MLKYLWDWLLVVSFAAVLAVVIKLAGVQGGYYAALARNNKVTESVIPAPRGEIVDRKGRVMAESISQSYVAKDEKDLGYELKRKYPYGQTAGLVTGYVAKTTEAEVLSNTCLKTLDNNDLMGKTGIEYQFDCLLRGVDGRRLMEVDAKGKYIRDLGRQELVPGETVKLSLDAFWQDKIYKMLNGRKAAVIISAPKTGKILAMVSSPAMDPNNFSYQIDNQMIKIYLQDSQNLPLVNRAIAGTYHSGSVFKPIMATAGLESGVIDKQTLIEDTGIIKVGDYSYSNWLWTRSGATNGMVNIVMALQKSNDIFFYRLGEKLGVARIKEWMDKFGLGQKTGIELPGELAGLAPDNGWKKAVKGENWYLGDTYHLSIGQGDLNVTPLQINNMTAIVANRGMKCKPSILNDSKPDCQKLDVSAETWATIVEGMKAACKPGGTAWPLYNFKTTIACKTGTAEVGDGTPDTHAWLTAFVPADDPEIAITVMVERGGEGSDTAAPIVGDILKEWFNEPDTIVPRYTTTVGE
ncbi:MAG: penicillin-binding transpeptidase domain-containing protein [Candidatus Shapirobacteria bacterium]|nr:penicillin-binding transpeptidase domain-containing protein [Candidatus Shapirobacteria bacterium]